MISVVGGGPAGCYSAFLLAKAGKKVSIFEEHKQIGSPVQCTGIVTSSIKKIVKIRKDAVLNKIKRAKISSRNSSVEIRLRNPNLVIDRQKFDQHLAEKAEKAGAKIYLGHKFIKNTESKIKTSKKAFNTEKLVGAEGPLSAVAKANSMAKNRKFWVGIQARAKLKNDNLVEFYPDIGTLAWVVPEDKETVRIGLLAEKNPRQIFQKFLKNRIGKTKRSAILEYQGGIVPIYNPEHAAQKNNTYLVGDAAGHVKATTGGGIIQGLTAANALADSITKNKDYESEWRKKIGRDLWIHLWMRKLMDKFREKDWQLLISLFKKQKNKRILENFDRDYPSRFVLKLILNEPRLAYFAKFLF